MPVSAARAAFTEALKQLFACAGEPSSLQVAELATALQQKRYPGMAAVADQRLSDWRNGKCLPQRFEFFEFVVRVLIGRALKRKAPPTIPGLYDIGWWRKLWQEARTATDNATDQPPQKASAPSPACPYQGLAAYRTDDQDRFFGRARAVKELTALIRQAQSTGPGIVLLTSPSGAGKSSLLSASLVPAITSNTLNNNESWAVARITPNDDPMTELQRCLDQPDVAGRAEGVRLLIIVDQGEQLFGPTVSAQSRAEFLDVLHTMSQPSTSTPGAVVVMGLRADALGRCVDIPELADAVQSRCMILGPMNKTELRDVITGPTTLAITKRPIQLSQNSLRHQGGISNEQLKSNREQ